MYLHTELTSVLAALWLMLASADPQTRPAGGVQTRPAAEPRSRYDRKTEYLMRLNDLPEAERKAKGRQRAERDYAAGWGELDVYGLVLFGGKAYADEETGLYCNLTGCCVWHQDEIDAYNQRLRKLVKEKGLPANAKLLRKQISRIEESLKSKPKLNWVSIPAFEGATGEWVKVGPYQLRWEFSVFNFTGADQKYPHLQVKGGAEPVEIHVNDAARPLHVALWPELDLLIIESGREREIIFWDLSYSRLVYRYDVEREGIWPEKGAGQPKERSSTQPARAS